MCILLLSYKYVLILFMSQFFQDLAKMLPDSQFTMTFHYSTLMLMPLQFSSHPIAHTFSLSTT